MVHYDVAKAERNALEFTRFPVPRTSSDIVRALRINDKRFYAKTPTSQVVKLLRRNVLEPMIEKNLILQYSADDLETWPRARSLLSYFYSKQDRPSPRKVAELYQANFLYLADDALAFRLPAFKDINLDACALLFNHVRKKEFKNFGFDMLNLIQCYSNASMRDRIRIEIYRLSFEEKEKSTLLRTLEVTSSSHLVQEFFNSFPFQPNLQKSLDFMTSL
ncbi:hypothetical protein H0N95_02435 [Candidatus Micrarchaeota archaeon]|nr:hypothetical protein [Candidatus Micrarchaeota archaeon]